MALVSVLSRKDGKGKDDLNPRRYTSFDEMKADEYRYWQSRPAHERFAAAEEMIQEACRLKGWKIPDAPRSQRPFVCPSVPLAFKSQRIKGKTISILGAGKDDPNINPDAGDDWWQAMSDEEVAKSYDDDKHRVLAGRAKSLQASSAGSPQPTGAT